MRLPFTDVVPSISQEWTPTEDAALIAHIRELLRLNIWAKVKDDPLLKERGSSRVLVHVDVLVSAFMLVEY